MKKASKIWAAIWLFTFLWVILGGLMDVLGVSVLSMYYMIAPFTVITLISAGIIVIGFILALLADLIL